MKKGKYTETYGGNFDLRPAWPISSALFSHDIPGFYARYVDNLKIKDFELKWGTDMPDFFTSGLEIEHFRNILLDNIAALPAVEGTGKSPVVVSNGEKATWRNVNTGSLVPPVKSINVR